VRLAFVGFGSLAAELAAHAGRAGLDDVRAYVRERSDPPGAAALTARMRAAGVRRCGSLDAALLDADVVVAAVPASAAADVAVACAQHLRPGSIYVDPSPRHPRDKAASSEVLGVAGVAFVDVAVLGTVITAGARVPMLAAGPGALRWTELFAPLGFDVRLVAGPPGRASLIKLVRSVYLKGRDALVLEMLVAAQRHGVEREVLASIGGAGEQVPFPELADRVLRSLAIYSGRRAEELATSAEVLGEAGVEPLVTAAASERLRRLGDLGLRERFHGERPASMEEVLAALEESSGSGADR
jgi:3-hydroxyisobutyrate dehydrogenase-like beta-hydroxyacid dehydrogenase